VENKMVNAPVAQRIRASASGAEGRRFESSQARQTFYLSGYGSGQYSFLSIAPKELTANASFCFTIRLKFSVSFPLSGPLAQLVEQLTLNQRVAGSNPARLTILKRGDTRIYKASISFLFSCPKIIFQDPCKIFRLNLRKSWQKEKATKSGGFCGLGKGLKRHRLLFSKFLQVLECLP
jgi:hypothetical protein